MAELVSISSPLSMDAIDAFIGNPNFFRHLLDELYEGVYFVDTHRRILYWNRAAEQISGYAAAEVIGRQCQDNILNHVDESGSQLCFGRCPLVSTVEHGVPHECDVYLHHKAGHRMPVRVHATPVRDANRRIVGAVEMFVELGCAKLREQRAEDLQRRGFLDPLTQIGNRRYLEMELYKALQEFRQHGIPFGAVLLDIDHLKVINEKHGHVMGDQALQTVARTLLTSAGDAEILGRWSVDEFLVLIPCSAVERMSDIAERCRALIEHATLREGQNIIGVTISGGASAVDPLDTMEAFVRRLENLLQRSKYAGRNRITLR